MPSRRGGPVGVGRTPRHKPSGFMLHQWYRVVRHEAVHVLHLTVPESLDDADFDRLMAAVLGQVDAAAGAAWVLDLASLPYAGSALLGLLVNVRQRLLAGGGRLVLCGLSDRLLQILRTCSLERLFVVVRHLEDAESYFD